MASKSRSRSAKRTPSKSKKTTPKSASRSKSASKKTTKRVASKSPSRTKTVKNVGKKSESPVETPRSRSRSRGRPAKVENKQTPRAASKSRSSSRSRSTKSASATPKTSIKSGKQSTSATPIVSSYTSSGRPTRTFERADDSATRSLRNLTQSRERPASVLKISPKKATPPASSSSSICSTASNVLSSIQIGSQNTVNRIKQQHRNLKRRLGVWYFEIIILSILLAIILASVHYVLAFDPAKIRLSVTSHVNKALKYTTNAIYLLKNSIKQ